MSQIVIAGEAQPPTGIVVETRKRGRVGNANTGPLTLLLRQEVERLRQRYPETAVCRRTKAIPAFNCHGLVFASRRTRVDTADVRRILKDDGYVQIQARGEVR